MKKDNQIDIFEVGPRDGLQNESRLVSFRDKIFFLRGLIEAGVKDIEIGAFVRPDRVPQMKDTDRIYQEIQSGSLNLNRSRAWCLVPNERGLQRALRVGVKRIAVFTAATESFSRSNVGMSISESFKEIEKIVQVARRELGSVLEVRGYVSTAFGCPFEGKVQPKKALRVIARLAEVGVDHLSIGDTIGVATPAHVEALIRPALRLVGKQVAVHFHDTRGIALANALRAIDLGVRMVDSSAGGLGGCPFAPGATGNLATEDLVFMLDGMGMKTGIDLDVLCHVSLEMFKKMKKPIASRYLQSFASKKSGYKPQAKANSGI